MERYGIDEDRPFAFLVRASSTSNLRLRDIAEELEQQANGGPAAREHAADDMVGHDG